MNFKEWKEEFIRYLQEKIKNNDIKYDDFKNAVEAHRELSFEIQKILESASRYSKGEDKDKLLKLYRDFSMQNVGNMPDYLQEKIKSNDIKYDDFKNVVEAYRELSFEIQKILEYASKYSEGKDKDKLWKLYRDFSMQNVGDMHERLRKLGYSLRNDKDYRNVVSAIQDQAYRIMEKTRHALRSEVEYMILRIFVANKKEVPPLLAKAFKPVYPDEIFKVFIYSFLSGILGETKEEGGEE